MRQLLSTACFGWALLAQAADPIALRTGMAERSGGGHSFDPIISRDGGHIVFLSTANNLVPDTPSNDWLKVYTHDLVTSNTTLVSAGFSQVPGVVGNSSSASVSSNGQVIAFVSEVESPVSFYGDRVIDTEIFVRDLAAGTTRLLTKTNALNPETYYYPWPPSETNSNPHLSHDGRWVFFESSASNLVSKSRFFFDPADFNASFDVFRYDLKSNVTFAVSRRAGTNETAAGASRLASITPDGRRVAFISTATNITSGPSITKGDVYVRDMESSNVWWASPFAAFDPWNFGYRCTDAALSEDGRFVLITTDILFQDRLLLRRDIEGLITSMVASNLPPDTNPQISANGRYVTFEDGTNIFRWDGENGVTEAVNLTVSGELPSSGRSRDGRMTPDGSVIVFQSDSPQLVAATTGAVSQVYLRDMAAGVTRLISATPGGEASTQSHMASLMDVAADGSRVVFGSAAADLVDGDSNGASDIFFRDVAGQQTTLLSTRHTSFPSRRTGGGHSFASSSAISSNGQVIAFISWDGDLVANDTNGLPDVYIAEANQLRTAGIIESNGVRAVAISGNGRYLVYARRTVDSPVEEVFRRDLVAGGELHLFSGRERGGDLSSPAVTFQGDAVAYISNATLRVFSVLGFTNEFITNQVTTVLSMDRRDAVFTPDGRFVLFVSGNVLNVFDRDSKTVRLIGPVASISVSGNSRFIAFQDGANYLSPVIKYDLVTSNMQSLLEFRRNPAISADGRFVAMEEALSGQVVLYDTATGTTNHVSVNIQGQSGRPASRRPAISADGRFIAFLTSASNLVPGHTNRNQWQVVLRDRLLGSLTLLSASATGQAGNTSAGKLFFSADGHTLVFESAASDLIPGDYNDKVDIFTVRLGVDSDLDQLDDDWEVAYFGNLLRDGSGDFDADGASDRTEFLGGTDPTNTGSVFALRAVANLTTGTCTLTWNGKPALGYRVEWKDDLRSPVWYPLGGTPTWSGDLATQTDPSPFPSRFYRVIRLP